MHDLETRILLGHYLEMGTSKAELSRCFGVSRRTIHYWMESGQLDRALEAGAARYSARPSAGHKLDPYKGIIRDRLGEFPKLSVQRLFEEVRAAGYLGGHSRVRDYVREVRSGEPLDPVVRFETPLGRARWTLGASGCLGAVVTRFWWFWATRARFGCGSSPARPWRFCSPALRARSSASGAYRRSCCSIR